MGSSASGRRRRRRRRRDFAVADPLGVAEGEKTTVPSDTLPATIMEADQDPRK